MNTYTAQITQINLDPQEVDGGHMDEITIYKDGEEYKTAYVESAENADPYDEAVETVIGVGVDFTWLADRF